MEPFHFDRLLSTKAKRRRFLIGAGTVTAATIASQWTTRVVAQPSFSAYPFSLGIASGDPLQDAVVLWTRLAPDPLNGGGMPPVNVPVQWQIALDENMRQVVLKGTAMATPEFAHSVHVDVSGLQPGRWYWYQFKAGNEVSPIGRTRTAPAYGTRLDQLKFAFASCQHWEQGYFSAYQHMAKEDLDVVFHLGDYIYEGSPSNNRPRRHANPEPVDLQGYRIRHAQYKTDPDLQAAHAAFPFICTWDDHEVDNDYANENSQDFDDPQAFLVRRAAAYQAYYEHIPLRPTSIPRGANMRLYRRFTFGNLAEFSVLDTRQYRDDQACDDNGRGGGQAVGSDCSELFDPARTMLGVQQRRWLLDGLARSRAQWNVIAQQYLMAYLDEQPGSGEAFWTDGWDGYFPERERILKFLQNARTSNPVVIGGDIHSFWVTDLKVDGRNPASPVVASEFVGTSISSTGVPYDTFASYLPENPHIKFFESRLRGYVSCTVNRQLWTSNLRVVDTVEKPDAPVRTLATYVVEDGKPGPQPA
ncbi:alkaline phosphatase D family protein [Iningainema tapete]|uniref:Alkaline phosphatase D family protein n=1 Tax=Iningainema tapete BLCC-T55 TaxID=2748662 RepID=A0A8J7C915_9CYAN|nr:alkaline phosphatase D family protein [Iningainema tapete]MBD2777539.1 alkaline phosphatase D family protein [Iningainema tapete BLCC-T55]